MRSLLSYANAQEERRLLTLMEVLQGTMRTRTLTEWALRFLPHYFTCAPSRMHEWLSERLVDLIEQRGQKVAVIAPRGAAKTTWVSKTFPLYCIVRKLEPYILLISDTAVQAEKNLAAIKQELESNTRLAAAHGEAAGVGPMWNNLRIETRNGVCVEAIGRGTRLRGRTFGPHRPTLMIVDDIDNDESVESPAQRLKSLNWLQRAVMPAGSKDTNVFVLGTALHRDDVLQNLKKTPGWENHRFQSILQEPQRRDLWRDWEAIFTRLPATGTHADEQTEPPPEAEARAFYAAHRDEMDAGSLILWPDREPLYDLMCLRATIGEAAFQAEKQGTPTSTRTSEWPDAYFGPSIWFDEWPETRIRVLALDPSKGDSETSDYSAYVLLALGMDGLLYVDADLARRDTTQIVEDGLEICGWFRPDAFAVESNSFQSLLQNEFERLSRERGLLLPMYGITSTNNKRVRIRTLTPYLRGGQFRFRTQSPGTTLLVEQLREFPSGRHDDGPDALEMALRVLKHVLDDGSAEATTQEFVTA